MDRFPYDKKEAGKLLADPDTKAFVLLCIALGAYGSADVLGDHGDPDKGLPPQEPVDPVELWLRFEDDFGIRLPDENENKLQALMLVCLSEDFYDRPEIFSAIVSTLNTGDLGDAINGAMAEITLPEIIWATFETALVRSDELPFSPQVEQLIEAVTQDEAEDRELTVANLDETAELQMYYGRYVNGEIHELIHQLRRLGIPEKDLQTLEKLNPFQHVEAVLQDGLQPP